MGVGKIPGRSLYLLVTLILAISANLFGWQASASERVSIQFKWFHQFQFAGYYAAQEMGYFAEEGLDVELREYHASKDPVAEVVSGRATYGIADTGLIVARDKGEPVVLVSQIFQHSPLILLTMKQSGLRTPFDLSGKKLMTYLHGSGDAPLRAMVQKALGGHDKSTWVQHTFNNQDLLDGKVDAMLAYSTNEPFWFLERGHLVNLLDPRDYGIDFYSDNLFTSDREMAENPGRVEKVRRAVLKGWAYAVENPGAVIDLIEQKYNTQNKTRAHLEFEARQIAELVDLKNFQLGYLEPTRLQKIAAEYQRLGFIDRRTVPPGLLPGGAAVEAQVDLTEEEQAWIAGNPQIRVGNELDWPPFDYAKNGEPLGYSIDLFRLVADKVGLDIEFINGYSWVELLEKLKTGDLDALPAIYETEERKADILFTSTYFKQPSVILVNKENIDIHGFNDLRGRTLALIRGYSITQEIEENYPDIGSYKVDNTLEGVMAVSAGKADALIESVGAISAVLNDNFIPNVQVAGNVQEDIVQNPALRFGINKHLPLLHSMIEKGLQAVTPQEQKQLAGKWLATVSSRGEKEDGDKRIVITLSDEERAYLEGKGELVMCADPDWMPYERVTSDSRHEGILAELNRLLARRLDVRIRVHRTKSWAEALEAAKARTCDFLSGAQPTPERLEYLDFTDTMVSFPVVIATRSEELFIDHISMVARQPIGLSKGYALQEILTKKYPDNNWVEVPNSKEGMRLVERGELYGMIDTSAAIGWLIRRENLSGLKVSGRLDENNQLSIATRNDEPLLKGIYDKAIATLTQNDINEAEAQWISITFEQGFDYSLLWKVVAGGSAILLVVLFWNRQLGKEISERKRAQSELAEKEAILETALVNMPGGIAYTDRNMNIVVSNDQMAQMMSLPRDTYSPGKNYADAIRQLAESGFYGEGDTDKIVDCRLETLRNPPDRPLAMTSPDGKHFNVRRRRVDSGGVVTVITEVTELKKAQTEIVRAHDLITQSIDYASNIQRSSLPSDQIFESLFDDHFVIWEPCEQVGGDFYAHIHWGDGDLIILADCTGHGVPGAFMTLISGDALNQALPDVTPGDCASLIQRIHQIIQIKLGQDERSGLSDDGLELGACYIPDHRRKLHYAGANMSLYVQDGDSIDQLKGDKSEIGYRRVPYDREFTNHQVETAPGRFFYMTTDGLPTQVGQASRLPFGNKRFSKLLASLGRMPMSDKKEKILTALKAHMGDTPQRDDVSLIGFEIGPVPMDHDAESI